MVLATCFCWATYPNQHEKEIMIKPVLLPWLKRRWHSMTKSPLATNGWRSGIRTFHTSLPKEFLFGVHLWPT